MNFERIKELEGIVVDKLRVKTDELGWVSLGPTEAAADQKNHIDWVYGYGSKKFNVQIKVVSPKYYRYQDIRVTLNEIQALRDLENLSRFQIEVCFDREYEELTEDAVLWKIEILDFKTLSKIIDQIEINPNDSPDLEFDLSEKGKLSYKTYYNKDGSVSWFVIPSSFSGYRFRKHKGKDGGFFICIPTNLKVEGKNLCKVYDLGGKYE